MAVKGADKTRPVSLTAEEMTQLLALAALRIQELHERLPSEAVYRTPTYTAMAKLELAVDYFRAPKRVAAKVELENKPKLAMEAHRLATIVAVRNNCCPKCGWTVRRNNSINGWIQCGQFGAVGFRDDANIPSCDWQGFTV